MKIDKIDLEIDERLGPQKARRSRSETYSALEARKGRRSAADVGASVKITKSWELLLKSVR